MRYNTVELINKRILKLSEAARKFIVQTNLINIPDNQELWGYVSDFGEDYCENMSQTELVEFFSENSDFWESWFDVRVSGDEEDHKYLCNTEFGTLLEMFFIDYYRHGMSEDDDNLIMEIYILNYMLYLGVSEINDTTLDTFFNERIINSLYYTTLSCANIYAKAMCEYNES